MSGRRTLRASTLYDVLGLSPSATQQEIKTEYRRLCLLYHPDISPGETAKFLRISEAYQTLVNVTDRRAYDQSIAIKTYNASSAYNHPWTAGRPFQYEQRHSTFDQKWRAAHYEDDLYHRYGQRWARWYERSAEGYGRDLLWKVESLKRQEEEQQNIRKWRWTIIMGSLLTYFIFR